MLDFQSIDPLIDFAFAEDIGAGDITTESTVPASRSGIGKILAKSAGVIAGLPVAQRVFERVDASLEFQALVSDGARVEGLGVDTSVVVGSGDEVTGVGPTGQPVGQGSGSGVEGDVDCNRLIDGEGQENIVSCPFIIVGGPNVGSAQHRSRHRRISVLSVDV